MANNKTQTAQELEILKRIKISYQQGQPTQQKKPCG